MNVRRVILIVVVLLGLTALAVAVVAPKVFGSSDSSEVGRALSGY